MNNKKTKPIKYSEVVQVALLSLLLTAVGVGMLKGIVYLRNQKIFSTTVQIEEHFKTFHNVLKSHYKSHNSYPKPPGDHILTQEYLLQLQNTTNYSNLLTEFRNPFNNAPYNYYSNESSWYVIISTGPDRDYDLDDNLVSKNSNPTNEELTPLRWNPSNGIRSGGDLFLFGSSSISDATQ